MSCKSLIIFVDDENENNYFSLLKTYDGNPQNMLPNLINKFLKKTKNLDYQLLAVEFIQYVKEIEGKNYDPSLSLRLVTLSKDKIYTDTDADYIYKISSKRLKNYKWILELNVLARNLNLPINLRWKYYSGYAIYQESKKLYDLFGYCDKKEIEN